MFKIEGTTIMLTRGDAITIDFSVEEQEFEFRKGDRLKFSVYKPRKMQEPPIFEKNIIVDKTTKIVEINLTSEETKTLAEMKSRIIELWYEIEFNGMTTTLGYDEEGAKLIKIFPEGSE